MNEVLVTGHKSPDTDSICSAIAYARLKAATGTPALPICSGAPNKETAFALAYFGAECPRVVKSFKEFAADGTVPKVILVDHNEAAQIIDDIDIAEIVENIDHHRIGGLTTEKPIFIHYEPVGCTSTIVFDLYRLHGVEVQKQTAGLMLSAIISDTVLFRSPTTTEKDKKAAHALADLAGVDLEAYGFEMLKAGADISDLSVKDIVRTDMKEFSAADKTITIAQISVMDASGVLADKSNLLAALEGLRSKGEYAASYLMVTDILKESTDLLYAGESDATVSAAFESEAADGSVFLPNTMSRKKQIVPPILHVMK